MIKNKAIKLFLVIIVINLISLIGINPVKINGAEEDEYFKIVDDFSDSSQFLAKRNDLGQSFLTNMNNWFNYGDNAQSICTSLEGAHWTTNINQNISEYCGLVISLKDWWLSGTENQWKIVLNDGTDHWVNLWDYGIVNEGYKDFFIPLEDFDANLSNIKYLRFLHMGNQYGHLAVKYIKLVSTQGKIDIGGRKLFLKGQGKGKPTVIFDSGYGDSCSVWNDVQQGISQYAFSVSYDRAGLGNSDDVLDSNPRTSIDMVHDWYNMLQEAGIKGPYIVVGHSFGGLNARLFASEYPNEVSGVILVDSTPDNFQTKWLPALPQEIQGMFSSQFYNEISYDEVLQSANQAKMARSALRNKPLTVITTLNHNYGMGDFVEQLTVQLQIQTACFSDMGKIVFSEYEGHYIHVADPDIVINEILSMLEY